MRRVATAAAAAMLTWRLAMYLPQVLYVCLTEAYEDATREQRHEVHARLRSLWAASGLPTRLELEEHWDLERRLESAGM